MTAPGKASTVAHALDLVTAAHKAKLSDTSLGVCETIARTEGASRDDVQRAVARGLQAMLVLAFALTSSCAPAPAAATVVTPPTDSVYAVPADMKIPGRFLGITNGVELWSMGDFEVRVRRVKR